MQRKEGRKEEEKACSLFNDTRLYRIELKEKMIMHYEMKRILHVAIMAFTCTNEKDRRTSVKIAYVPTMSQTEYILIKKPDCNNFNTVG